MENNRIKANALEWWKARSKDVEDMIFRTAPAVVRDRRLPYAGSPKVPAIELKGPWLQSLGWNPGDHLVVDADRESIRIYKSEGVEDPPGYEA